MIFRNRASILGTASDSGDPGQQYYPDELPALGTRVTSSTVAGRILELGSLCEPHNTLRGLLLQRRMAWGWREQDAKPGPGLRTPAPTRDVVRTWASYLLSAHHSSNQQRKIIIELGELLWGTNMLIYEVCVTAGGKCVKRISIIILDIFFTGTVGGLLFPIFHSPLSHVTLKLLTRGGMHFLTPWLSLWPCDCCGWGVWLEWQPANPRSTDHQAPARLHRLPLHLLCPSAWRRALAAEGVGRGAESQPRPEARSAVTACLSDHQRYFQSAGKAVDFWSTVVSFSRLFSFPILRALITAGSVPPTSASLSDCFWEWISCFKPVWGLMRPLSVSLPQETQPPRAGVIRIAHTAPLSSIAQLARCPGEWVLTKVHFQIISSSNFCSVKTLKSHCFCWKHL